MEENKSQLQKDLTKIVEGVVGQHAEQVGETLCCLRPDATTGQLSG